MPNLQAQRCLLRPNFIDFLKAFSTFRNLCHELAEVSAFFASDFKNKVIMKIKNETKARGAKGTIPTCELTLLQAIEHVVEISKDSKLSDEALNKMEREVSLLSERLEITAQQAILFCICMEKGPRHIEFDNFATHLGINKIRALSFAEDVDALVRRRLLKYRNVNDEEQMDIPMNVIKDLKHNEVNEAPLRKGLDCFGLFEAIKQLFEDLNDNAITPNSLYEELRILFQDNPQVQFVKVVEEILFDDREDFLLLILFCHLQVNEDDDDVRFHQMEEIFSSSAEFCSAKAKLRSDEHPLIANGYIQHRCEEGIASPTRFQLTAYSKLTLLSEMKLSNSEERIADVIKASDLAPKQMFYEEANRRQVEELSSFLVPKKYDEIRSRMKIAGFRTGFACLFYGGPGTGKTETAYQLARETGRDIMVVDVPQIKSKWVGDSEKNIKALFDRYRGLVEKSANVLQDGVLGKPAPILLFNEADAIIGIRKQGASSAVDKMENSIQNIILQEMEALDGIMIATTNLTESLDTAFERRFLYKICFEKPDPSVRQRLWQSMMPGLTDADAYSLASSYDFSGGQIENISRKATINSILHGENSTDLTVLKDYCDAERLENHKKKKIGFG